MTLQPSDATHNYPPATETTTLAAQEATNTTGVEEMTQEDVKPEVYTEPDATVPESTAKKGVQKKGEARAVRKNKRKAEPATLTGEADQKPKKKKAKMGSQSPSLPVAGKTSLKPTVNNHVGQKGVWTTTNGEVQKGDIAFFDENAPTLRRSQRLRQKRC